MDGTGDEQALFQAASTNALAVSPDGHWLAYDAVSDGRSNVYVRPYPGPGVEVRVSPGGGRQPAWSPDGTELYYIREDSIVANPYAVTQGRLRPGAEEVLFQSSRLAQKGFDVPLAVLGRRRFVVVLSETEPDQPHMNVVLNWSREVAARLAGR